MEESKRLSTGKQRLHADRLLKKSSALGWERYVSRGHWLLAAFRWAQLG